MPPYIGWFGTGFTGEGPTRGVQMPPWGIVPNPPLMATTAVCFRLPEKQKAALSQHHLQSVNKSAVPSVSLFHCRRAL